MPLQQVDQCPECAVLRAFVLTEVIAFKLYADGKVVASLPSSPAGDARMPCARTARDQLNDLTVTPDEEVRGNTLVGDAPEILVSGGIQAIGEEIGDRISRESAGRQADRMHHDKTGIGVRRTGIEIRAGEMRYTR
jgi:hypothetical protein